MEELVLTEPLTSLISPGVQGASANEKYEIIVTSHYNYSIV